MTADQVFNRIAAAMAPPAPVPRLIRVRPHAGPIPPPTPGARTGVFPATAAGDPSQGDVTADQVEEMQGYLTRLPFRHNRHHRHHDGLSALKFQAQNGGAR
jgi:hypothetical protein